MTTIKTFSAPDHPTRSPLFYGMGPCSAGEGDGDHFHLSWRAQSLALTAHVSLLQQSLAMFADSGQTNSMTQDIVSVTAALFAHMSTNLEANLLRIAEQSPKAASAALAALEKLLLLARQVLTKAEALGFSAAVVEMELSEGAPEDSGITAFTKH